MMHPRPSRNSAASSSLASFNPASAGVLDSHVFPGNTLSARPGCGEPTAHAARKAGSKQTFQATQLCEVPINLMAIGSVWRPPDEVFDVLIHHRLKLISIHVQHVAAQRAHDASPPMHRS